MESLKKIRNMDNLKKAKILKFCIALVFILIGAGLRLVSHPPNFTPIAAIALFGGFYLSKRVALFLPFAAMLVSDMFLGFYDPLLMASVYGSFLLCVVVGFWLKKNKEWFRILSGSLACSLLFFVITNFSFWAFTEWYSKTLSGLVECFVMATPFFRNGVVGDLFYVALFFGIYELVGIWIKKRFKILEPSLS